MSGDVRAYSWAVRRPTVSRAHIRSSPRFPGSCGRGSYGERVVTRGALGYVLVLVTGGLVGGIAVAHLRTPRSATPPPAEPAVPAEEPLPRTAA